MKIILAMILAMVLMASTCKNPLVESALRFWVKNESGTRLSFLVSRNYPDTTIPDDYNGIHSVRVNDQSPYDFRKKNWSEVFEELPADTLTVFVFSTDTLVALGWQQLRSNYKILKRYDLSLQDFENRNYIITYP